MSFTPFRGETCRRDFGKMALGSALGALVAARASKAAVHPNAPGIKLCAQSDATPSDDQLLFLKQIGAEYVSVGAPPGTRTALVGNPTNNAYGYISFAGSQTLGGNGTVGFGYNNNYNALQVAYAGTTL